MAPGTSIGAASPVGIGGAVADSTMQEKVENFSVSYIRSIADKHGRNADWAEQAVRKSVALTDREAVEQNVVDLNAATLDSLLVRIDGTIVEVREGSRGVAHEGRRGADQGNELASPGCCTSSPIPTSHTS